MFISYLYLVNLAKNEDFEFKRNFDRSLLTVSIIGKAESKTEQYRSKNWVKLSNKSVNIAYTFKTE